MRTARSSSSFKRGPRGRERGALGALGRMAPPRFPFLYRTRCGLGCGGVVGFEHAVDGFVHAAAVVDGLGAVVVGFDVEAESADVGALAGLGVDVGVEGFEDAAAAGFGEGVDALDPPEVGVAPIGPFIGDHHLAGGAAGEFGDQVEAAGGIVEDGADAGAEEVDIEGAGFGFERHGGVAVDEEFGVFEGGGADGDFGHAPDL